MPKLFYKYIYLHNWERVVMVTRLSCNGKGVGVDTLELPMNLYNVYITATTQRSSTSIYIHGDRGGVRLVAMVTGRWFGGGGGVPNLSSGLTVKWSPRRGAVIVECKYNCNPMW